jgi:predicted DNA-binding transcriptional regulator AlpA
MKQPDFPESGLVRLKQILKPEGPLPISKSAWWSKVRSGEYPPAIKLGPRTTCWEAKAVRALFEPQLK